MNPVTVDDMKRHLVIESDDAEFDVLIQTYIDVATVWVGAHLRRDMAVDYPVIWPAPVRQAVRLIVGHFFVNREAVDMARAGDQIPLGVRDMLAPYRDFAA